jgi:hypothetical protein
VNAPLVGLATEEVPVTASPLVLSGVEGTTMDMLLPTIEVAVLVDVVI